jgi:putative SOS response-associated peptidase YedK
MCGRFNLTDSPLLHILLDELGIDIGPLPLRFNIAPTEPVLTIYQSQGKNQAMDMRWWLTPSWSNGPSQKFAMFNARSETIDTSKAYKSAFQQRRAIVPANAFIEWQRNGNQKQAYEITPMEGVFAFAAVWEKWQGNGEVIYSCSMITTESVPEFKAIHSRQPVMLDAKACAIWLDGNSDKTILKDLLKPRIPCPLQAQAIDNSIGNARNKSASLPLSDFEPLLIVD